MVWHGIMLRSVAWLGMVDISWYGNGVVYGMMWYGMLAVMWYNI
jgi:hypothetical protein